MKKVSRICALILALMTAVSLLGGCSNTPAPSQSPTPSVSGASQEPPATPEDTGLTYPMLTEEPATLSVWQVFTASYISTLNDQDFATELEKRTNVKLTFREASSADALTTYNLMITSGDYTDIIHLNPSLAASAYPGGGDRAIEDGVFLSLNDLIEEFAPNYSARRAANPDVARQTITDKGNIWSMYTLNDPAEYPWTGLALRGDILQSRGIALPVTLGDWEIALQTFSDEGMQHPLLMDMTGVSYNSEFLSAYGVGREFYQVDGTVKFGYIEQGFKDYLEMMNGWYEKGFVDREFASRGISRYVIQGLTPEPLAFLVNGNAGAAVTVWGATDVAMQVNGMTTIEGFNLTAVSAPKMNKGDTIKFRYTSYEAKTPNAITSACKNPELAVRLLDYLYSDEGSLLINYGIEGVSYNMVDGKPRYVDSLLSNADGFTPRDVAMKYTWDDGIGMGDFKRLWQRYEGTASEGSLKAYDVWNTDSNANILPPTSKTVEEGQEYSSLYGDITTYSSEMIPQFIIGTKPISEFDAFVSQLKTMGIEKCIEIQQAALDRYNDR